jgi:transcriptional regulator with XRE-family HTH domain
MINTTWSDIIRKIQANGMTRQQIADRVGVSIHTIHSLACGRANETSYTTGRRLLEMADIQAKNASRAASAPSATQTNDPAVFEANK